MDHLPLSPLWFFSGKNVDVSFIAMLVFEPHPYATVLWVRRLVFWILGNLAMVMHAGQTHYNSDIVNILIIETLYSPLNLT